MPSESFFKFLILRNVLKEKQRQGLEWFNRGGYSTRTGESPQNFRRDRLLGVCVTGTGPFHSNHGMAFLRSRVIVNVVGY